MNINELQYLLGMAGTVAFSVTAVLAVSNSGVDLFGACVLGLITSIGGGTIRDLILDVPVFWATDLNYIWVSLGSSFIAFYTNRLMTRKVIFSLMLYIDGLGVSMFAIQAAHKVQVLNFAMPLGPILLGVLTAIGGGLIRDMLSGSPTLLMRKEIYAVPVMFGCTLYVILLGWVPADAVIIGGVCALFTFSIRAAAIHWNLSVPDWMLSHAKNG
jgi:uncharacterized membrane protein YeiH